MNESVKVLVIEDDPAIAELHQKYLERVAGVEVIGVAHSQVEAEIQLGIFEPDLVLLDVYLPDGNGLEILKKVRSQDKPCDVILITAARETDTLQHAMRGGVIDYLLKPVAFSRLEASIEKYLVQRKTLDQGSSLDQSLVDKMLQSNTSTGVGKVILPKGIDSVTLDKIREVFESTSSDSGFTADEAGEKIGASRTTARRYLEYLVGTGEIEADVQYGSVGRPERSYSKAKR